MSDAEPDKPDLSLIGTDDLISELFDRHDAALVVREIMNPAGTRRETLFDYAGGVSTAIGLAQRVLQRLLKMADAVDTPDLPPPSDE